MFYKSKKENLPGQDIPHKTIKINLSTLIILIILTIIIAVGSTILIIKSRNNKHNKIEQEDYYNAQDETIDIGEDTDFLSEIKAKYPSESENICTNGDNYWLLSPDGEKIYFYDLESFEMAMQACFTIKNENDIKENFEKMIDKKTFLDNLTNENKYELANFIKTQPIKTDRRKEGDVSNFFDDDNNRVLVPNLKGVDNFIEEKFLIKDNEILYCPIYETSTDLSYSIYIITPAQEVPANLSSIIDLTEYFVINRYTTGSANFGKKYGVTDADIEKAKAELDKDIEKSINMLDERKGILFADIIRKSNIMFYYLSNCDQIPKKRTFNYSDIMTELYPTNKTRNSSLLWTKGENYSSSTFYCQAVDNNKVLCVTNFCNELIPESNRDECYTEYYSVGTCISIDDLPFCSNDFSTRQLILTGYLPEYSENNFVITNITKKLGDKSSLSEQENSKLITEHSNYIHSYFGL